MSEADGELEREFLAESREHLAGIETDLIVIEERGADIDEALVNRVFRAAHSIKGGSGYFGLTKIQELAHKTETVLSMVRSRKMVPDPEVVSILLQAFDRLGGLVNDAAGSNSADVSVEIAALVALCESRESGGAKLPISATISLSFGGGARSVAIGGVDLDRARQASRRLVLLRYGLMRDVEREGKTPLTLLAEVSEYADIVDAQLGLEEIGTLDDDVAPEVPFDMVISVPGSTDVRALSVVTGLPPERIMLADTTPVAAPTATPTVAVQPSLSSARAPAAPVAASPAPLSHPRPAATGERADKTQAESADGTLRVNVSLLDGLMNLAGELVLSRNQLRNALGRRDGKALTVANQRINAVTSDLQEAVMQARLQPVGNLLSRFHRLVRDLARTLGKEVQLEVEGREVELDRSLIEGLGDPLTHMVRNAVDHGIEAPEVRIKAGKNRAGTLWLKAYHEAGQVVIEVRDDGKGIDPVKVAASAVEKGLASAEKVLAMSERDKVALIFLPGLSTADAVSAVSGRGVGMDVVKTNLDRLGGAVEIESTVGAGSLFRITLPLTLAIMPSLVVSAQGEAYAIPQTSIVELIRVPAEEAQVRIEVVGEAEVLALRGELVPLVRLSDVLGLVRTYRDSATARVEVDRRDGIADRRSARWSVTSAVGETGAAGVSERRRERGRRSVAEALCLVVLNTGTLRYGLVVGELHDTEEIVVKPLGRHLRNLGVYAGATIRGDGTVALILDVAGIAKAADLSSVAGSARAAQLARDTSTTDTPGEAQAFLLFHASATEQCALPLSLVLRVEEISAGQVEMTGGRRTMQYRGASLPVVALSDVASTGSPGTEQELCVILCRIGGRQVGVLGAMPVDVVETDADVDEMTLRQRGVLGSAIIRDRTVLLVDLHELVQAMYPDLPADEPAGDGETVLLAEDSDFFRSQVKRFLIEAGYAVLEAPDGEAAWELLEANSASVRAVVTDIEMPRLDGLAFTRRIRGDPRFRGLLVIGLTSLAGEQDVERGRAAGIDDYQVKLDRDQLVASLRQLKTSNYLSGGEQRGENL